MKNALLGIVVFLMLLAPSLQATCASWDIKPEAISFESEIIADDNGHSFSQYSFLFWEHWNALARGFVVEPNIFRHGEFEFGPTFRFTIGGTSIEILNSFGFTTEGSFTSGHMVNTTLFGKKVLYLADPKWYFWNKNRADELFHRFVVYDLFRIAGIPVSLRSEHLTDYRDTISWRIGPQISLSPDTISRLFGAESTFTIMPHYEARFNTVGVIMTFTVTP